MTKSSPSQTPSRASGVLLPGFAALPVVAVEQPLGDGRTFVILHPAPSKVRGTRLTVMSFNILLGGLRRQALLDYFARLEETGRMPDIIGLQEANLSIATLLASRFGFHLAYFGQDDCHGSRRINGKAYLSHHPLRDAAHFTYTVTDEERRDAISRQGKPGDLLEDRGVLWMRAEVWGVPVLFYNVHHALADSGINTRDLHQLNLLLRRREWPLAVVLGDFNADTSLIKGHAWELMESLRTCRGSATAERAAPRYGNPESTVGGVNVGTIVDPRLLRELQMMEQELPETLAHTSDPRTRLEGDLVMTPRQAIAELHSGAVGPQSGHWRHLRDIADSATLASLADTNGRLVIPGKRFDNLYASPGLEPILMEVDRSTQASDHPPVIAHYLPRGAPQGGANA
ncbi:endonuclease/exonuclease/phosphatase family protein [Corallococcus terminator]